ncbi:unnamed protein product [Closterium sp. Naga37s-1]|nr:unnamed protein product [Closterium sp. Naga37s-1]
MPPKWGSAGAAAANTELVLLLYITPSAPGSSIFVQVNLFPLPAEEAAANTSLVLLLYITPSAPGSSIVVHVNLFPFLQRKAAANTSLVLAAVHHAQRAGQQHRRAGEPGDSYFLHCQERVLAGEGAADGGGAGEQGRGTAGGEVRRRVGESEAGGARGCEGERVEGVLHATQR